jgi:hypothetical protein
VSVQPDGTRPPGSKPVVVQIPDAGITTRVQGWVQAVGFLLISLALLLLSVAVLRNPAPPIAAPDGAGKGPVGPGPTPPPVAPVLPPASRTEVARAAVAYRDGLGANFARMAGQIKSGEMKTLDAIGTAFRENGLAIANPLHDMILKHCDPAGNVTDAAGLADEMKSVAEALGAK